MGHLSSLLDRQGASVVFLDRHGAPVSFSGHADTGHLSSLVDRHGASVVFSGQTQGICRL